MPGFDGTGPRRAELMTGGGRGFCNPAGAGYGSGYGRGFGRGAGIGRGTARGRGFGRAFGPRTFFPASRAEFVPAHGYGYPMRPEEEVDMLRAEADSIKSALDQINRRIEELQKNSSE